jgi:hypothetical protein
MRRFYFFLILNFISVFTSYAQFLPYTPPPVRTFSYWMGGDNVISTQSPVYGTKGVPSTSNYPGVRYGSAGWSTPSGILWLFGGYSYLGGTFAELNDLWKFNPTTKEWTWVSGDNILYQPPVYGTKGVASITNKPGPRHQAVTWTDASGNLWLFGGSSKNDLWKFNPSTSEWTWVSGDNINNQGGIYGTKGVPSTSNKPGARYGANGWIDPSGNLWLMGGDGYATNGDGYLNDLWKFNPLTNEWTWVSGDNTTYQPGVAAAKGVASTTNKPGARHEAVTWTDGSGNLWLFGGYGVVIGWQYHTLLNDLWKFNPLTNEWTWVGGNDGTGFGGGIYGTKGVASATNQPGSRRRAISWTDGSGNFWMMGGLGNASNGGVHLNDLWKYKVSTNEWTWVSGDDISDQPGIYDKKFEYSELNKPGARFLAVNWIDAAGNLWLMGGSGLAGTGQGFLNDLWRCDIRYNYFNDGDGDSYGTPLYSMQTNADTPPAGFVTNSDDCNDIDAAVNPNTVWYLDADHDGYYTGSGIQQCLQPWPNYTNTGQPGDCNDADAGVHSDITYYKDGDGDGFGDAQITTSVCSSTAPTGYVTNSTDCDDTNADIKPGTVWYLDSDNDGYYTGNGITQCSSPGTGYKSSGLIGGDDCNDSDASVHTNTTYYRDADGDGYGDAQIASSFCSNTPPNGYVNNNSDCNDNNVLVSPATVWYLDADNDGYYSGSGITQCSSPGAAYRYTGITGGNDCNNTDASIYPNAPELCDGKDNNCNGATDEGCNTLPVVSIQDVSVFEAAAKVVLTVSLDKASSKPISVQYATQDGTAISNATNSRDYDYTAASGTVSIKAGKLSATITLMVKKDRIVEATEYFKMNLSLDAANAQKAVLGISSATVTVLNSGARLATDGKNAIEEFNASVIPNPSNHQFILRSTTSSKELLTVRVFDVLGRVVERRAQVSPNTNVMIGENYRPGLYFVEINQGAKKAIIKIIKQIN